MVAACQLGVLAISRSFLKSPYIRQQELASLLARAQAGGCRVIPVLLKPVDFRQDDLHGLDALQIYRDHRTKSFSERSGERRNAWAMSLEGQIHAVLRRYFL